MISDKFDAGCGILDAGGKNGDLKEDYGDKAGGPLSPPFFRIDKVYTLVYTLFRR